MQYLLAIAIGPVQDFIAVSRKTRDLWFGSMMLSDVSRAVAETLHNEGEGKVQIIFPSPNALAAMMPGAYALKIPVANQIRAIVKTDDPGPAALAEKGEEAANKVLTDYLNEAKGEVKKPHGPISIVWDDVVNWTLAENQLKGFLEYYAAWYPYDPAKYKECRLAVERLLAGRKALRDFLVADGIEGQPKSSLDPSRESVLFPAQPADDMAKRIRGRLKIKAGEQLDGISLVKRHAQPKRFVSISRVAVDPYIRRLARDAALKSQLDKLKDLAKALEESPVVESFKQALANGLTQYESFPWDTQLFFDEGLHDRDLVEEQQIKDAKAFYAQVVKLKGSLDGAEPPIYLAVIAADGDKMGKAIGALVSADEHVAFSDASASFAKQAEATVAKHCGALVYSGGDDVLAFLPLDKALACANTLKDDFATHVQTCLTEILKKRQRSAGEPEPEPITVSLSVGVAIGHYGEHLQNLLAWARDAERAAKKTRNALAVALHTRTGGETARTVVSSWTENPVEERWNRWITWHRADEIPDGAAYELQTLDREFRDFSPALPGAAELLRKEVRRIMLRKQPGHGSERFDQTRLDKEIMPLLGDDPDDLRQLVDELIIARRIAAAFDVAAEPAPATTEGAAADGGR